MQTPQNTKSRSSWRPQRARYASGRSCMTPEEKVVLGKGREESVLSKTKHQKLFCSRQAASSPLRLVLASSPFRIWIPQRVRCSPSLSRSWGTLSRPPAGFSTLSRTRSPGKPGAEHPSGGWETPSAGAQRRACSERAAAASRKLRAAATPAAGGWEGISRLAGGGARTREGSRFLGAFWTADPCARSE